MIYTYHSDLIISLRNFLDNNIFPADSIKGYQFNIGDRALQIKNDPRFELPRVIINYESCQPISYKPYTLMRSNFDNKFSVPVLYNKNKNLSLLVHEELFEFNITVIINCESQLSALTFENLLQNKLPVNKYFYLYDYYSFNEIDNRFLTPEYFDVNSDEILNLFVKFNASRNITEYCYSIQYSPLIRMNSISTQIGSTDQRSFTITCSLTLMNHIPVYHDIPSSERRSKISKKVNFNNVIIPYQNPLLSIILETTKENICTATYCDNFNITDGYFRNKFKVNLYSGEVFGNISNIEYIGYGSFFKNDNNIVEYKCRCDLIFDIFNNKYTAKLDGDLNGILRNISVKIFNDFIEIINSEYTNADINNIYNCKVYGNFKFEYLTYALKNVNINYDHPYDGIKNYSIKVIPVGKLYDYFYNTIPKFMKFDTHKIVFKKAVFRKGKDIIEYEIDNSAVYNKNNHFIISNNNSSILPFFNIHGDILPDRSLITYTIDFESKNDINIIELLYIVCDFEFESFINNGAMFINKININVISRDGNSNPILDQNVYFEINRENIPDIKNKQILRSYIIDFSNKDKIFIFDEKLNKYFITLIFDSQFDYNELIKQNKKINWAFYFSNSDRLSFEYIKLINPENINLYEYDKNILKFECSRDIYNLYFSDDFVTQTLIFEIYIERI